MTTPRPGRPMQHVVEYRDTPADGWKPSRASWDFQDVSVLNKLCGYMKYRILRVFV